MRYGRAYETENTVLRDEEGRMHLELGTALYRRGEFAGAAAEFQAAYDASHRSPLLYNVYVAYRDKGRLRRLLRRNLRLNDSAGIGKHDSGPRVSPGGGGRRPPNPVLPVGTTTVVDPDGDDFGRAMVR